MIQRPILPHLRLLGVGVLALTAVSASGRATAAAPAPAPCRFEAPADLDAAPARWLGECPDGSAEGLGVLRGGTGEPYAFFAGIMHGGRPAEGLLMLREGGWMVAVAFDEQLKAVQNGGMHPEWDDRAFAQARAGALATADWFRRQGNAASAAYYTRLAQHIVDGRPE